MELEESLLTLIKIESSSEYESERETNTNSILFLYIFLSLILLSYLLSLINSSLFYNNNMSQHDFN